MIEPIRPSTPRVEPPAGPKRSRRPPRRARDEEGLDRVTGRDARDDAEDDADGDDERPSIDLRA